MAAISADRLRYLLSYDPDTGGFTWLRPTSFRVKTGQSAGVVDVSTGYLRIRIDKRLFYGHRLAWLYMTGDWPPYEIDHRNRKKTDNSFKNLRLARHAENSRNVGKLRSNTSGTTGVFWCKTHLRWVARIEMSGVVKCLGYFREREPAVAARFTAERELFGEFAVSRSAA